MQKEISLADFAGTDIVKGFKEFDLIKAQQTDLIKGGEGSKGGKVIGHTKSGKPIYEMKTLGDLDNFKKFHKDYDSNDHRDAARHFNDEHEGGWSISKKHLRAANKKIKEESSQVKKKAPLGKTSSGKEIHRDIDHEAHKNYTKQDHADAAEFFGKKIDEGEDSLGWHDAMNNGRTFSNRKKAVDNNYKSYNHHLDSSK